MNSFYIKYLKYKNKYLKIKKQVGGMREAIVTHKPSGKLLSIQFPDDFFCPLSNNLFEEPVISTDDGNTYEKCYLLQKFGPSQEFLPNIWMKNAIEDIIEDVYKKKLFVENTDDSSGIARQIQGSSMKVQLLELQRAYIEGFFNNPVLAINSLIREVLPYIGFTKGFDMDSPTIQKRDLMVRQLGWSIPSTNVTDAIVKHVGRNCVLSLAAGLAAQETLLAAKGVSIVCADLKPPRNPFMPVERLSNDEAVAKWRLYCEVVMLVWPEYITIRGAPFPNCHTYEALLKGNFSTVVYIGEKRRYTGSKQLEDFLEINYNEVELTHDEKSLPTWPGIDDYLRIFRRKSANVVPVPKPEVPPATP
jgi:hypothetical protein